MLRFLQNVFASMSLERKCLLFFGSALLLLMCGAFWIMQFLATKLVIQQTQQVAGDYGDAILALQHVEAEYEREMSPESAKRAQEVADNLLPIFLNESFDAEVLGLGDSMEYHNLPPRKPPEDAADLEILQRLQPDFVDWMTTSIREQSPGIIRELDRQENDAFAQVSLASHTLSAGGVVGDRYVYYKPIFSGPECTTACHSPVGSAISFSPDADPRELAEQYPFRVMKVSMPYAQTHSTNTWIRALLISIAILIIAVGLFVLHAIVRYLVLRPLYHLRDVSDAISHGDTGLRAAIDTEDEFRELADAFNRMLRHLTETQDQIRDVNRELDKRVDQLAQLNLQLYEANRLKSDFLANMSHELRTPLNSIIGFSDVLQGIDSLTDKQRRYASNIQRSGRVLLEMINDILDLAKVEAGKMEVRRSTFDLTSLVRSQVDMVRGLSDDKNIGLSVEAHGELPMAEQDQNKIGQILTNLLSNAIKFTPEGGLITVTVRDRRDGRFCISVADTGIGIAAEDQAVIFEKFRQSRTVLDGEGLTREFSGTGLGLSIVKELCKLLGGEISFNSQLGHGSTFRVTLPWRMPEPSETPMATTAPLTADGESINTEALQRAEG